MATGLDIEAIVIGGSWGGMDALTFLLSGLPALFEIPLIVVLHRKKNANSFLKELIARHTLLRVREIEDKEPICASTVYLAPANYHVLIEKDRSFSLDVSESINHSRPSIDCMFESAALVYKKKLLGVILTGANSDGSEGLKTIADLGGLTMVQDPLEAQIKTMPLAAMNRTKVDYVFKLEEMQKFLLKLV